MDCECIIKHKKLEKKDRLMLSKVISLNIRNKPALICTFSRKHTHRKQRPTNTHRSPFLETTQAEPA